MLILAFICCYVATFLLAYNFYFLREQKSTFIPLPKEILGTETIEYSKRSRSWSGSFFPLFGFIDSLPVLGAYRRKLITAGEPMRLPEFIIFKVFTTIASIIIGVIFLKEKLSFFIILLVVGFFFPDHWLLGKIKKRKRQIGKDLPVIIDLLKLCVGAGMDFMLAVQRVIRDFRPSPLVTELKLVWQETQMGKSRRDALKNFSQRVDMPEVYSFVRTLIQAGRMGTPISEALEIQSEEIRFKRFQTGEELALKAPIKLLFPLVGFILPVVLIIVGGPILLQFVRGNALQM